MSRQQQIVLLVVLLIIGGAVWGWQYWPSASSGANGNSSFLQGYQTLNFPESRLHTEVIERRHRSEYKGTGVNPFSLIVPPTAAEIRKNQEDQKKAQEAAQAAAAQQVQQQAQNIDLPGMKFFGYGTVPNGTPRRAFLSYQDDVYIVGEGDMLMGRYRIVKINNSNLEFEEVSSGRHGQKALEDQGPGA